MMTRQLGRSLAVALAGAFAGAAQGADLGTAFTYQGQLVKDGSPLTSSSPHCDFTFGLWDADAGGNQKGSSPQAVNGVEVVDGNFTVSIDFGTDSMDGTARWLEIAVQCPGDVSATALAPRQELTPAPYALALPALRNTPSGDGGNPDSANVIGGHPDNTVGTGVAGATVAGGGTAGADNTITANFGAIGGGRSNTVGGVGATVSGGEANTASGGESTVGGGGSCTASNSASTVGGGGNNTASGSHATVGGGRFNTASGSYATIAGGGGLSSGNTASGSYSAVPGGQLNMAGGSYSLAAGRRAKANHDGSFVWADSTDADFASTGANQFLIRASGNVGINENNPGAALHVGGTPGVDGIMFPDGTLQTTAAVGGGNTLDEAYDQGGTGAGRMITADSGAVDIRGPQNPLFVLTTSSGFHPAIWGATSSTASGASAVYGNASGASGFAAGVYGFNSSPDGYGVRGESAGAGVYGSGEVYGGQFLTTDGVGILGQATGSSGVTKGVFGQVNSPLGYAGYSLGRGYFSGDVGIGELNPSEALDVVGNVEASGTIRSNALEVDTNTLVVDSATSRVGIGTNSPGDELDVVGDIHASGTLKSGNSITIDGTSDTITASSGTISFGNENLSTTGRIGIGAAPLSAYKVYISGLDDLGGPLALSEYTSSDVGVKSLLTMTLGTLGTASDGFGGGLEWRLEDAGGSTLTHVGDIAVLWSDASAHAADMVFKVRQPSDGATTEEKMRITSSGKVGIGRSPTANMLEVAGNDASKGVAGSWIANSDARIKTKVETIGSALDTLDRVRLVTFEYTDAYLAEHKSIEPRRYMNVIAQEFAEIFPDHVKGSGEFVPGTDEEILQVDTYPLTIYSAAAVQELHALVRTQQQQITSLQRRLAALEHAETRKSN